MSVTNTQLIHRTVSSTTITTMTTSNSPPILRSFLVPSGSEGDDKGLVMRLDSKMDGGRAVGSTPVPAKLCGQSKAVAQWALWTWGLEIHKVSGGFQKFWNRILPILLYAGILVLSTQVVVVLYLLTKSLSTPTHGAWFLLACIAIMCYYFVSTLLQGLNSSTAASSLRRTSSTSSSKGATLPQTTPPSPTNNLPPSPSTSFSSSSSSLSSNQSHFVS